MRTSTAIVSIGLAMLTIGLGLSGHITVTLSPTAAPPLARHPVVVPAQPEARGKGLGNAAPLARWTPDEATMAILQSKLADALQRKADLLTRYNSRHPAVVNLEAEIRDINRSIAAETYKVQNIERRAAETQRNDSLATPPVAVPVAPVTTLPSRQAWRQAPADFLPSCSEQMFDNGPLPRNWPCARVPVPADLLARRPAAVTVEAEIRDIEQDATRLTAVPERFPPGAVPAIGVLAADSRATSSADAGYGYVRASHSAG
jgi:hypothetical protein